MNCLAALSFLLLPEQPPSEECDIVLFVQNIFLGVMQSQSSVTINPVIDGALRYDMFMTWSHMP
jgi:hypothetical protein